MRRGADTSNFFKVCLRCDRHRFVESSGFFSIKSEALWARSVILAPRVQGYHRRTTWALTIFAPQIGVLACCGEFTTASPLLFHVRICVQFPPPLFSNITIHMWNRAYPPAFGMTIDLFLGVRSVGIEVALKSFFRVCCTYVEPCNLAHFPPLVRTFGF